MDVNLPGIDGIEAARQISAGDAGPVVVLLSTYDEDDFDRSGCGAAAYISKAALSPARLLQAWSAATTQGADPQRPGRCRARDTSSDPPQASTRSTIASRLSASRLRPCMETTSSLPSSG